MREGLPPLESPVTPERLQEIRNRDEWWQRDSGRVGNESPADDRRLLLQHIEALEAQLAELAECANVTEEIMADFQTMKKILKAQYLKSLERDGSSGQE